MNIYTYFSEVFGQPPEDETLEKLPMDSNCGRDCVRIILAAEGLLTACRKGCGVIPRAEASILSGVNYAIEVCWRG